MVWYNVGFMVHMNGLKGFLGFTFGPVGPKVDINGPPPLPYSYLER